MQAAQAGGMTKSLKKLAMLSTSMAAIGSWMLVNTKLEIEAPAKPVTARMRRATDTLLVHARQDRGERGRDDAADAAEEQRQAGEQRAFHRARPARLAQIGRQPGDVEPPAVGEADVLRAKQPDRRVREQRPPGNRPVDDGGLPRGRQHRQLRAVHAAVRARVVAIPGVERNRPDDADQRRTARTARRHEMKRSR